MISTGRRTPTLLWSLGCAFIAVTVGAQEVRAQGSVAPDHTSRLRAVDAKAAALLKAGNARSTTFRLLTEAIERSDLVVWVSAGHLQPAGQVQFVAATPYSRYVRVAVRLPGLENALVCTLAHELQHVVEIADASEVRDTRSLLRFYERIGWGGRSGARAEVETANAQRIGLKVLNELLENAPQAGRR
jgi:hypothetical protein